jgi:hypothetical protein
VGCAGQGREVLVWFLYVARPPGRFRTSLLHWPPAARQSVDHCRALLCHCGLVSPSQTPPARPPAAVTMTGPGSACGPRAAGPRYQSPSKVEGLAEAAGLRAGCNGSICMHLSVSLPYLYVYRMYLSVYACMCMYPQSFGEKNVKYEMSYSMYVACVFNAFIYSDSDSA